MPTRDPDWAEDEIILALDLLIRKGMLRRDHPDVIELSGVLQALRIHDVSIRTPKFRNANGVARKLADLGTHMPGYTGTPTRGGRLDLEMIARFTDHNAELQAAAQVIRSRSIGSPEESA